MDNLTKEQRRRNMQAIKAKDTTIELTLRKKLFSRGVRYRVHRNVLGTHPDISINKYRIAIFCDGDFWHGRTYCEHPPTTNEKYWYEKIRRNKERDLEQTVLLRDNGWIVLRFWESDIKGDIDWCVSVILSMIEKRK